MATCILIASALLLLGSDQATSAKGASAMLQLDAASAGQRVTTSVGQQLQVTLAETPSTGFRWRVGHNCDHLLQKVQDESHSDATQPGAPGRHSWIFTAKAEGSCELHFESARSWETGATGKAILFPVTIVPSS